MLSYNISVKRMLCNIIPISHNTMVKAITNAAVTSSMFYIKIKSYYRCVADKQVGKLRL